MKNLEELREYLKNILRKANEDSQFVSMSRHELCDFQADLEIPGMIPQMPCRDPKVANKISDALNDWLTENQKDWGKTHIEVSRESVRELLRLIDPANESRLPEP